MSSIYFQKPSCSHLWWLQIFLLPFLLPPSLFPNSSFLICDLYHPFFLSLLNFTFKPQRTDFPSKWDYVFINYSVIFSCGIWVLKQSAKCPLKFPRSLSYLPFEFLLPVHLASSFTFIKLVCFKKCLLHFVIYIKI